MSRTRTPPGTRDVIRERIARELAGGEPTGLRAYQDPRGAIGIRHVWAAVTATPLLADRAREPGYGWLGGSSRRS